VVALLDDAATLGSGHPRIPAGAFAADFVQIIGVHRDRRLVFRDVVERQVGVGASCARFVESAAGKALHREPASRHLRHRDRADAKLDLRQVGHARLVDAPPEHFLVAGFVHDVEAVAAQGIHRDELPCVARILAVAEEDVGRRFRRDIRVLQIVLDDDLGTAQLRGFQPHLHTVRRQPPRRRRGAQRQYDGAANPDTTKPPLSLHQHIL